VLRVSLNCRGEQSLFTNDFKEFDLVARSLLVSLKRDLPIRLRNIINIRLDKDGEG
jgi:hypothetical protein